MEKVSKLYAYSGENPLIFIEKANCYSDLDKGQTDLVGICLVGLH